MQSTIVNWDKDNMSIHEYKCNLTTERKSSVWTGEIQNARITSEQIDADVVARGSYFRMIVGKSSKGNYLCVPNWNIGIQLANWTDYHWNYERLTNAYPKINRCDATSIISAIREMANLI